MELHLAGESGSPVLLLLPEEPFEAEEYFTALKGLEKDYRLLLPVFAEGEDRAGVLGSALNDDYAGRIWGAWGCREGAGLLLSLIANGSVSVHTVILEGGFELPGDTHPLRDTGLVCWINARDKAAKKSYKALSEHLTPTSVLTMKKLKKAQTLFSVRPDMMEKQLRRSLGYAVTVQSSAVLTQNADSVWSVLRRGKVSEEQRLFPDSLTLRSQPDRRVIVVEGSSPHISRWSHLTRVSERGDRTVCTDQVEVDAGKLNPVAVPLTRLLLKKQQRARSRALRKR